MGKEDFVDTDFLLIMKMKQGNEEAFDEFVRKYYEEILRYCRYHCFDTEYAEDLTQETFLKFFANLSEYHYKGKTKNYLYTVAGNLCKNFYKKKKDIPTEGEKLESEYAFGEGSLDFVLDKMIIEAAMEKLSDKLREVVILYYFQECKLSEIAGILRIGLPLVKYRLKQAKKQLEQIMGKEEFYEFGRKDGNL